ncbi:hypothetical protein IMZ31_19880 (plasmid) [Pontibacillus sp. ALD_SL1]|uniref:hypothetical protein n=1 Tax=Pontibacillus sp. ALD_SL1 TaxID=2777185 RepID=UPI001A9747C6|nr:hypothetical protein [Pontibacillus sp. ALD_SL1]QST02812.1 hypothetical protein IMZ31_19880 [Pontibacillus sp. ALD_SL1]
MGMFDTFIGWVVCPFCDSYIKTEVQSKSYERLMNRYHQGDWVTNTPEAYEILEHDAITCDCCEESFDVTVIGYQGHVYGFSNESPENWESTLDEWENDTVTIRVSKKDLEREFDEVIQKIETRLKDTSNNLDVRTKESIPRSPSLCRVPHYVEHPTERFKKGDRCYYDNRTSHNQLWKLHDTPAVILDARFKEERGSYHYTINLDGVIIEDVEEKQLWSENRRNQYLTHIESLRNDFLEAYDRQLNPHKKPVVFGPIRLKIKYSKHELIQIMKERGELPQDFTL